MLCIGVPVQQSQPFHYMASFKSILTAAALAVSATAASATPFVFVDGHLQASSGPGAYVRLESYGVNSYTNTWDISDEADFSSTLVFDSATASFWFSDDVDSWQDEHVSVDLGAVSSWLNNVEVGGTFASYELVSGNLSMTLLADIAADGKLTYTVRADSGDFYLKETQLTVYAHVPDGGSTLMLLGLALVGFAALRRRSK